jgi:hypothetical protein
MLRPSTTRHAPLSSAWVPAIPLHAEPWRRPICPGASEPAPVRGHGQPDPIKIIAGEVSPAPPKGT